jgi:hypothetical protein
VRFWAAALALSALTGCTCKPIVPGTAPPPERSAFSGRGVGAVEPLFDDTPSHPLNAAHALLFSRERSVGVAPCSLDGGCLGLSVAELHRTPFVTQRVHEGGDEPLAFIGGEVDFLSGRAPQLERALATVIGRAVPTSPVARALFQNDLWERFEALSEPGASAELVALKPSLARAIAAVALTNAELAALPQNFAEVGRAYPELLPGWGGPEWLEVRAEFTDNPTDTELRRDTKHAERWGHRYAFRVLARVPPEAGGADWLRAHLTFGTELPAGTTLALVGSPLVLSKEGEVVPLSLVTLVELRRSTGGTAAASLGELPYDVLEGKRALLRLAARPNGGLVHLGPETPVPVGATCLTDRTSREPLKGACAMCHGNGAMKISGPFAHGEVRLMEEKDPTAAAREIARIKKASPELASLRGLWR